MQEMPKLGQLIDPDENPGRDAVHIAIAPVVAGEMLEPGDSLILRDGLAYATLSFNPQRVGIVDPFLKENVQLGQKFYLFLLPGTVTSLRHVWTHPAFVTKIPQLREMIDDQSGSQ